MENRVKLIWATRNRMSAGQQTQLHAHTCLQAYYILSGTSSFIIDGSPVQVGPGDFFAIPVGAQHRILPHTQDGSESYEMKVILSDPFLQERLGTFHPPLKDSGAVRDTMDYIFKYWSCQDSQNLKDIEYMLTSLLLQLFLKDLHYEHPESKYIRTERYNPITRSILSYIDNNFTRKISVQDIGAALGYNRNYLSTVFRRNTGLSIIDYVNYVRIRRAIHYFAFYGQDVFTTFESTGFSSLSYFSSTFKSITGISPRDFRRAFTSFPKETAASFVKEPVLNFLPCTIEDGFRSMKSLGKTASDCLDGCAEPPDAGQPV